ncbi:MAG: type II CRISPR-associated endonuclease Cas1 [Negativicoccus succinicivorans]|nr:type II CRISPR-associated endonuclease Cas1 [Negativicoccus succinicivorans]
MSWRTVVITKPAKLELRLNYMVIRSIEHVEKISLTELGALVIETLQVSITGSLISALLAQEIRIIICDEHHDPQGEVLPYYGCHDCSRKIQMQIGWQETTKKLLWQQIVRQKIMNQRKTLAYFCSDATDAVAKLAQYETQVEIGDATHRESLAAKEYFPALLGKGFTRAAETAQNAALNYGYQIIISIFSREIKIAGYLTELGIFHDSQQVVSYPIHLKRKTEKALKESGLRVVSYPIDLKHDKYRKMEQEGLRVVSYPIHLKPLPFANR